LSDKQSVDELLGDGYYEMVNQLVQKVNNGEASTADFRLLAQLAREHDVQIDTDSEENPFKAPAGMDLPFTGEDLKVVK
jgi:hypothetical protein